MIEFGSALQYNNGGYGKGTAYIAKLSENTTDSKYEFEREFMPRDTTYINNSKTTWYQYSWKINTDGLYEFVERNNFKNDKTLYIVVYNNGTESSNIKKKDVKRILDEKVIEINNEINEIKNEFKDERLICFDDYNIFGQYKMKEDDSNKFIFNYSKKIAKLLVKPMEYYKNDDIKTYKLMRLFKKMHEIGEE